MTEVLALNSSNTVMLINVYSFLKDGHLGSTLLSKKTLLILISKFHLFCFFAVREDNDLNRSVSRETKVRTVEVCGVSSV